MRCINSDFIIAPSAGARWQIGELSVNLASGPAPAAWRCSPSPTIISSTPQYTPLRSFVIRGWRTGISNTDTVVIYSLFALLARHVIAMHDAISLGAPGI